MRRILWKQPIKRITSVFSAPNRKVSSLSLLMETEKKKRTRCRAKSRNTRWGAVGVDSTSLLIPPASSQHGRRTKVQKGQSGVLWSELRSQPLPPPPILSLHNVPVVVVRQPTFGGGVVSVLTDWREAGGESPTRRAPRSRSALLQRQHTQRCRLRRRQQEELMKS